MHARALRIRKVYCQRELWMGARLKKFNKSDARWLSLPYTKGLENTAEF